MTDRSRACIVLVNASTNANGKRTIGAYKANQASSKASCSQSYSPQSGHECVDGENLVRKNLRYASMRPWSQGHVENETDQGDHGSSE
jgi:hypothetical protein